MIHCIINPNYVFFSISFHVHLSRTPKYKPRRSDYDLTESPDHEELMDTTQIIRDSCLARQLDYEEKTVQYNSTTELNKVRQTMCDSIYARKLQRYQQLGLDT